MDRLSKYNNIEKEGCVYDKEDLLNLYRLQKQLLEEENIVATLQECINIWEKYSDDLCASWLFFPDNDKEILQYIYSSDFFTKFEDYCC